MPDEQTGTERESNEQYYHHGQPGRLHRRQQESRRMSASRTGLRRERWRRRNIHCKRRAGRRRSRNGRRSGFVGDRIVQKSLKIATFEQRSRGVAERLRRRWLRGSLRVRLWYDHRGVTGRTIHRHPRLAASNAHELIAVATAETDWHRGEFLETRCPSADYASSSVS